MLRPVQCRPRISHTPPATISGWRWALLFALIGGLILNLMPCVLPILAMKALSVASKAGADRREAAREGFAYGAGAVLSFAALGMAVVLLRASGAAVGWGFQLQEPAAVGAFALLIFAVGLNLSGVFELAGGIDAGDALTRRGGALGAFFTGVLAVAVAAPCTAPFMAAALGFALTQSALSALAIFLALGIGFAAPFVAIGLSPALLRLVAETRRVDVAFQAAAGIPDVWRGSVARLGSGAGIGAARIGLRAGRHAGARFRGLGVGLKPQCESAMAHNWCSRGVARIARCVIDTCFPGAGAACGSRAGDDQRRYSVGSLFGRSPRAIARATKAGVRRCDRGVVHHLSRQRKSRHCHRHRCGRLLRNITSTLLIADWTRRDAAITSLLDAHGRSGVPLYLYYAPGAADAQVLPQVLTPDAVLNVISQSR